MEQYAHRIFVEYVRKCAKEHVLLVSMRRRPKYPSELTENASILQLKPHKHPEDIFEMIHAKLTEYGIIGIQFVVMIFVGDIPKKLCIALDDINSLLSIHSTKTLHLLHQFISSGIQGSFNDGLIRKFIRNSARSGIYRYGY